MSGKKYFNSKNPKGEIAEWKVDLNDRHRQKDCLKKIIASMTVGKDVSGVFPEVTSCSQTGDLELKKLVYLYLINYAKTQPELAILAVNTFVKDANDSNPMLRALAIRTMGCIRVDRITEYLCDPLERSLKDADPYVRKTAAICVSKLYDMTPDLVEERGFLEQLKELVHDSNPMVVSNAVAALAEIQEMSGDQKLVLTKAQSTWLLNVMEQCTEWGQVYLLECLAAKNIDEGEEGSEEATTLIARVLSRLQHANSAVVLAAIKVVLKHIDRVSAEEQRNEYLNKLAAPMVTLLSQKPEIQFVALRNINLILQKYPDVLKSEARVFYCKYNDPIYIKLEKLDIMVMLASEANTASVLAELKEYAQEIDVDFVRKSVNCIGQVAIRLESAAPHCVEVLRELVGLKVSYVVQEAIVVIKDIFRCYPDSFESVITDICAALDSLEEPDAKAAMIWIIGEYADRIDNSEELLSYLLDNFLEETTQVQLQLLTATVKLFLKKSDVAEVQTMISTVLTAATKNTDNPDLRDRAFMYWRLLSSMPQDAADIVLAAKPAIQDTSLRLNPGVRDELLKQLASLSSVYHKLPHTFVKRHRATVQRAADLEAKRLEDEAAAAAEDAGVSADLPPASDAIGGTAAADAAPSGEVAPQATTSTTAPEPEIDLLGGLDDEPPASVPTTSAAADDLLGGLDSLSVGGPAPAASSDPFGMDMLASGPSDSQQQQELPLLVAAADGHGCEVHGRLEAGPDGSYSYAITVKNCGGGQMSGFHVNFNKNALGLGVASGDTGLPLPPLPPGQTGHVRKTMVKLPDKLAPENGQALQLALKWAELTSAPFLIVQDTLPPSAQQSTASYDDPMAGLL